jgi:hypothetical protein
MASVPANLGDVLRTAFRRAPKPSRPLAAPPRATTQPALAPVATDLAQELAASVQDESLRAIIARASQRFHASERRLLSQRVTLPSGNPTLCWPDAKAPHERDPDHEPRVRIFPLDDRRADAIFVLMELRKVSWLAGVHPSEVLRKGYTRGVCRKAVAVMLAKWPGQVLKSDAALFLKICDELNKSGRDPRRHPGYRAVRTCAYAMAFAGIENKVSVTDAVPVRPNA